ncbi:MAG: hypothetical protein IJ833_01195 [Lachnospiraceae bacterium]|nr:hypothetical protein [Lachnospiraceae bacterium]
MYGTANQQSCQYLHTGLFFNQHRYDLKTLTDQATENTIFNRVKKAKRQTKRFILDLTEFPLTDEVINSQIDRIFWSKDTMFVEELVLVREYKIVKVFARK